MENHWNTLLPSSPLISSPVLSPPLNFSPLLTSHLPYPVLSSSIAMLWLCEDKQTFSGRFQTFSRRKSLWYKKNITIVSLHIEFIKLAALAVRSLHMVWIILNPNQIRLRRHIPSLKSYSYQVLCLSKHQNRNLYQDTLVHMIDKVSFGRFRKSKDWK